MPDTEIRPILDRLEKSRSGITFDRVEPAPTLRAACTQELSASVVLPDLGILLRARFLSYSSNNLKMVLIDPRKEDAEWLRTLSACVLTFYDEGKVHIAICTVKARELTQSGRPALVLLPPENLVCGQARQWFRVPVSRYKDLAVTFTLANGAVLAAQAIDLGLGGLMCTLAPKHEAQLAIGDAVLLTMQLAREKVECRAQLRRKEEGRYSLMFMEALWDYPPLRSLVGALERRYLQERR